MKQKFENVRNIYINGKKYSCCEVWYAFKDEGYVWEYAGKIICHGWYKKGEIIYKKWYSELLKKWYYELLGENK